MVKALFLYQFSFIVMMLINHFNDFEEGAVYVHNSVLLGYFYSVFVSHVPLCHNVPTTNIECTLPS